MMKLFRSVQRLEQKERALAAGQPAAGIGLVWSAKQVVVDPAQLERGEHIATDFVLEWRSDGLLFCRASERIARDPEDLGAVSDPSGAVVGRVTRVSGTLFDFDVPDAVLAALPEASGDEPA